MADYTARNLKYRLVGPGNRPVSGATITATLQLPGGEDLRFGEDLPIIEQIRRVPFTEDADTAGLYSTDLIPNTGTLENSRYRVEQQTESGTTDFYISMPNQDVGPTESLTIEDIHEVGELTQEVTQPTLLRRLYNFLLVTLRAGPELTITRDDANRQLTLTITGNTITTSHIAPNSVTKDQLVQSLRDEVNDAVNDVAVSGRDVTGSRTGGGTITGGTISGPTRGEVYDETKEIIQQGENVTVTADDAARTLTVAGQAGGGGATPLSDATPQAPGTASAGTSDDASRADHVHPAQSVPQPSNAAPAAPGAAAQGSSTRYARQDHVHPAQSVPQPSNAAPVAPGTAAQGSSPRYARQDHRHPAQAVPQPYNGDPEDLGTAAQGTSDLYARGDHVHALPDIPEGADDTDVPLIEGTAAVGTSERFARADHVHPEGGGGGGGNVNQAGVYALLKNIVKAGYRILLGTDDTKSELTVSVVEVPSGAALPPKPWHLGQRFNLLDDVTVEQDRQAVYLEAESGPTETVWSLPGLQLQIRAYGAGHSRPELRNKVYLLRTGDYAFPPSGTITLTWYRTGQARQTYTVSRAPVAALVHWHLVNGGTFALFGTTETQFGYLTNLQVGTGARSYPDADVARGSLIFNGGAENAGWIPNPRNPAAWAQEGQPYPGTNLAAEILLDGPATGITVVRGGATDQLGPWTALLDEDGNAFDFAGKSGSVQCTVPMIITSPSAQNIGWDSRGIAKAVVFSGPVFVRDVLAAPAAAGIAQGANVAGEDVYNGANKDATIRLQIGFTVDGARRPGRYRFVKDGDRTDSGYTVGPNGDARIELWRQEPTETTPLSDVAPAAPGTAAAGTSTAASRADHVHPAQAVPEPSNAAPLAPAAAGSQGSSARYSRQDHRHPQQAVPRAATSGTPSPPGAASRGTSNDFARADHRHPAQSVPQPSNAAPLAPAASAVQGSSTRYARQDHVHPEQDVPQPATATPLVEGTGAVGTSARYAREDHVHPAGSGGGGGGGTTTLASAFPVVYAPINAASAINLTDTDWTAWQDVPGVEITVTAAQAGSVVLDGHVHGVMSSASGGGDRAYVGARVIRTRGTATRVCSRTKDYVRNASNFGGISPLTREGEDDVLCLEEAQAGDVFKLQVRARQQTATTRTFDLTLPQTAANVPPVALADQHPGCQLVMGPLGKAGADAPFRRVLHAGAGGSITVPDTDDHTYNPITLFAADPAQGTIALDVDTATGGGFVTRAQLSMTAKSKPSLAFQSGGGDLSPEVEADFLLTLLRAAASYDSALAGNTVFGVFCGEFQVYDGTTELGAVSLYLARQSDGLTGFRLLYDHAGTAGASFTATLDLHVSFFPMDAREPANADPARSSYFNPVQGSSDRYARQDHEHPNSPADNLANDTVLAAAHILGTAVGAQFRIMPSPTPVRVAGPYTSRPSEQELRSATWAQPLAAAVAAGQLYYVAATDLPAMRARIALGGFRVSVVTATGQILTAFSRGTAGNFEYLGHYSTPFATPVVGGALHDLFEIVIPAGSYTGAAMMRVEDIFGYALEPERLSGPVRTLIAATPAFPTAVQADNANYRFAWSLAAAAPSGWATSGSSSANALLIVPNAPPANLIGIAVDMKVGETVTARGMFNPGPIWPRHPFAGGDTVQKLALRADTGGPGGNARQVAVGFFSNRTGNGSIGIDFTGLGDALPAATTIEIYAVTIGLYA